ncbi:heme exporter protein CcmD [Allosphingosinicella flava]|uniref:Heme exporter protein D n=1 Tax=Allosphingosinicella flava TaxID=2771430 RepID=A0A7T2GKQ0_9SPHN|nr:heme exporter protein CcmD [Sphingosinicella flava]QPQ55617.1 heme exporter protein CcmD [Sphingosinicella flava]
MNHWPFIIAAYGLTLAGAGWLAAWSFIAMRRAERDAGAVTRP